MTVRAVFFDLGGTLFSYGALRGRFGDAFATIARDHAPDVPADAFRRAYQLSVAAVMTEYTRRPFYLHRELFAEAHRRMLAELGVTGAPDAPVALAAAPDGLGLDAVAPREGTRAVLERLRRAGLHLSVVSNIDDDQFEAIWSRMGLADLFDAVTTSEEARSCKPHPGIFERALAKAGVPASAVAFVGDSLDHDVAGANALGMKSFWLSRTPPAPDAPHAPDHVIGDLRELPDLLLA